MNKLLRTAGPFSYRLLAVDDHGEVLVGRTRSGNTLKADIAEYRAAGMKPLYAVFVRPRDADVLIARLAGAVA